MHIHLTDRNNKMGKTTNISLPPIISCANSEICRDECYAVKFYRMWPEVKNAWDANFKLVVENDIVYFSQIRRYLLKKIPHYFRWHVSGDILDQNYLEQMKIIAKDYYFINFLVFTKYYTLNFNDAPKNLSIILSIWPGLDIPNVDLPFAFIEREDEKRAYNYIKCLDDCEACRICWELKEKGKNVLLKKH